MPLCNIRNLPNTASSARFWVSSRWYFFWKVLSRILECLFRKQVPQKNFALYKTFPAEQVTEKILAQMFVCQNPAPYKMLTPSLVPYGTFRIFKIYPNYQHIQKAHATHSSEHYIHPIQLKIPNSFKLSYACNSSPRAFNYYTPPMHSRKPSHSQNFAKRRHLPKELPFYRWF